MNKELSLIERARLQSDTDAFATVVRLHQGQLRAFLVRLCQHYSLADDLAQDTFLQAYRKLPSFSGNAGQFQSWLYSIAYREFLQQRRSATRYTDVVTTYSQQFAVLHDRYEQPSTEQLDLEQAMGKFDSGERAAISLCHSYGFSHAEAATILELPVGTVKSRILRGKKKLRELLGQTHSTHDTSKPMASKQCNRK